MTDADVTRAKLASAAGAVIESVQESGAAGRAGFKSGDVVLSFDSENVRSARHLQRLIDETPDGREVAATVMRAGERVNLKITIQNPMRGFFGTINTREFPSMMVPEINRLGRDVQMTLPELNLREPRLTMFMDRRLRLGIGVQELTTQLGEYFGRRRACS